MQRVKRAQTTFSLYMHEFDFLNSLLSDSRVDFFFPLSVCIVNLFRTIISICRRTTTSDTIVIIAIRKLDFLWHFKTKTHILGFSYFNVRNVNDSDFRVRFFSTVK